MPPGCSHPLRGDCRLSWSAVTRTVCTRFWKTVASVVLAGLPQSWVEVNGDPKRAALDAAVAEAGSVRVSVVDTLPR